MTAQDLQALLDAALLQQFPTGVTLIREANPRIFCMYWSTGWSRSIPNSKARNGTVPPINPISTFILAAVVSDQPYLNSARTLTDLRVLLIPARHVREAFSMRTLPSRASWCA